MIPLMNSPKFLAAVAALTCCVATSRADVTYTTILDVNQSVTGVRGYDASTVILTGSLQSGGATVGMWWQGSLETGVGTTYSPTPSIGGQTVTSSLFYGPNTALFDPSLGSNIRITGSYQYSEASMPDANHGFLYTGPVNGVGGTWINIDVPGSAVGGATVLETIPHSTMGNFVVGNYDLQDVPASANAFLYNISSASWEVFDLGGSTSNLTSAYGIWQNGEDSYTIVGGSKHEGINKAYLVDYTPSTGEFSRLTFFDYEGVAGLTHFEGITGVSGGYNVIATTADGAAFAHIARNLDGSFGPAEWTALDYPDSTTLTTGNTVYENIAMGVYTTTGVDGVQSYTATVTPVPEPSAWALSGVALAALVVFRASRRRRAMLARLPLVAVALVLGAPLVQAAPEYAQRSHLRNARYGEILVVTGGPFSFTGHVYNTIGLNDCPQAAWEALDPATIKKQFKARSVILNGPRYFMMDTNALAHPGGVANFGPLEARHLADLAIPLTNVLRGRSRPYTENKVARTTKYVFKKDRPVYELVSPKGVVYVMQSYARIVDPKLSESDLPTLGKRLKLPDGWQYRVRVPKEDLVLTTSGTAYVLQDDLENSYQRQN
jgi:hypothetical protein